MSYRSEYGAFTRMALRLICVSPSGLTSNQLAEQALQIAKSRGEVLSVAKDPKRSLATSVNRQYTHGYLPGVSRRMGSRGEYVYFPSTISRESL